MDLVKKKSDYARRVSAGGQKRQKMTPTGNNISQEIYNLLLSFL